jgi:signal transduction histidine kinase
MTREQMAHIFDPFFTTKRDQGGTGLGLAIVHAIIDAHDGDIYAESAEGGGTKFTISIPLASEGERPNEQDTHH